MFASKNAQYAARDAANVRKTSEMERQRGGWWSAAPEHPGASEAEPTSAGIAAAASVPTSTTPQAYSLPATEVPQHLRVAAQLFSV